MDKAAGHSKPIGRFVLDQNLLNGKYMSDLVAYAPLYIGIIHLLYLPADALAGSGGGRTQR